MNLVYINNFALSKMQYSDYFLFSSALNLMPNFIPFK